jgi:hypothetical protein
MNQNTVIAESLRSEKWSCAKILTAKKNGFIDPVSTRKNCQKNGTAKIAVRKNER